jgi:hypothetical protein
MRQANNICGFSRAKLLHAYDTAAQCRVQFDRIAREVDAVLTLEEIRPASGSATPLSLCRLPLADCASPTKRAPTWSIVSDKPAVGEFKRTGGLVDHQHSRYLFLVALVSR